MTHYNHSQLVRLILSSIYSRGTYQRLMVVRVSGGMPYTQYFNTIASTSSSSSASSDQLQTKPTIVSLSYTNLQISRRSRKAKMNGGLHCYVRVRFPTQVNLADKYFSLFNFIARHLNIQLHLDSMSPLASRITYIAAICMALHDSYVYYQSTQFVWPKSTFVGIVKIKSWSWS